ncbi:MAG TPA: 5'/3'-nucleotidase SurE [Pseudothermotoga sp.]
MRILITNDDGVTSTGLLTLAKVLAKKHNILVVAPESEQSATGHAITVRMPIWVKKVEVVGDFPVYATTGTPADCVKIGVEVLAKKAVDLVISGINYGHNLGTDVIYSGTVSGALEGALLGIPALAVSAPIEKNYDYHQAALFIEMFIQNFDFNILEQFTALNINFPSGIIKGWRATKQSTRRYADRFEARIDPAGNTYYWMYGDIIEDDPSDDSDYNAIKNGYVSVTPITVFMNNDRVLMKLKEVENAAYKTPR